MPFINILITLAFLFVVLIYQANGLILGSTTGPSYINALVSGLDFRDNGFTAIK